VLIDVLYNNLVCHRVHVSNLHGALAPQFREDFKCMGFFGDHALGGKEGYCEQSAGRLEMNYSCNLKKGSGDRQRLEKWE
jgi:hypothetical protein